MKQSTVKRVFQRLHPIFNFLCPQLPAFSARTRTDDSITELNDSITELIGGPNGNIYIYNAGKTYMVSPCFKIWGNNHIFPSLSPSCPSSPLSSSPFPALPHFPVSRYPSHFTGFGGTNPGKRFEMTDVHRRACMPRRLKMNTPINQLL